MLAERIKSLRSARGISQVELAGKLGVTKQTISNWENSNIQPSVDMLVLLADFFGTSTDYLLGRDSKSFLIADGLTEAQKQHIKLLIDDITAK